MDFSRGGLNVRLNARIQTLLRSHIWGYFFARILTLPDRKEKIIFVGRFEILSGK